MCRSILCQFCHTHATRQCGQSTSHFDHIGGWRGRASINVVLLVCLPMLGLSVRPQTMKGLRPQTSPSSARSQEGMSCLLRRLPFVPVEPAATTGVFQNRGEGHRPSCAIVSNSGMLIGSGLGKEIDSHDSVWRLNMAPIEGYEKDVGHKTHIRLLNDHGTQWLWRKQFPYEEDVVYIFDVMQKTNCTDTTKCLNSTDCSINTNCRFNSDLNNLLDQHPEGRFGFIPFDTTVAFNRLMIQEFNLQRAVASTGAIAVLAALHVCDTLDLYHMAHTKQATRRPFHYWERGDGYIITQNFHGGFLEQDLIYKMLAGTGQRDFETTGRLTLEGFAKSSCDKPLHKAHHSAFLNVTETAAAMQDLLMMNMRKTEIASMERLSRGS